MRTLGELLGGLLVGAGAALRRRLDERRARAAVRADEAEIAKRAAEADAFDQRIADLLAKKEAERAKAEAERR